MQASAASVAPLVRKPTRTHAGTSTSAEPTPIAKLAPCRTGSPWRRWMRSAASTVVPPVRIVAPMPAQVVSSA